MEKKYHFTSLSSLESIFRSGEFRFSDLGNANDPGEGEYSRQIIAERIKASDSCNKTGLLAFFNINTTKYEDLRLFSISLSFEEENIHNWMEYGKHGRGAAIVFDAERLEEALRGLFPFLNIREVIYDPKKWEDAIDDVLKGRAESDFERSKMLLEVYPFLKHPSYTLEKEWRIAFVQSKPHLFLGDEPIFYVSRDMHYVLNVKKLIEQKAIVGIVFGRNVSEEDKNKIKGICKEYGDELSFITSAVPVCQKGGN